MRLPRRRPGPGKRSTVDFWSVNLRTSGHWGCQGPDTGLTRQPELGRSGPVAQAQSS
ncbi:protein of unknown function [Cyanobium sp. NIES-981]|nr:protein of unknown function [Cyanobium sp. NIES-981]